MEQERAIKRVLIISAEYPPDGCAGGECAVKAITDRLISPDIEFHMVTRGYDASHPQVSWVGNILVHRIPTRDTRHAKGVSGLPGVLGMYGFYLRAALLAHRLHRASPYDAVWAVGAYAGGLPAVLFTLVHKEVLYVQTIHEADEPEVLERRMKLVMPLFRRVCTAPDFIQATSTFRADWAKRVGATCPVHVIPDGIPLAPFSAFIREDTLIPIRNVLSKQEGDVWLVSVSPLSLEAGIDTVVDALALLPQYVKYAIIGAGSNEAQLRAQVVARSVEGRVVFVGGNVGEAGIPAYLRVCDIFMCPGKTGWSASSCVKAMASAMPVIGTREGDGVDMLFDEAHTPHEQPTAWVVEKSQPIQIAEAVHDILANPDKVQQVLENARLLITNRYTWDVTANDMRERIFSHVYTARAYTGK